jgi:carbon-monoxide dehydrogenase small subunit
VNSKTALSLEVNGRQFDIAVEPRRNLADALREDCGLTGTHLGCEHGVCGACTVLVEGKPVRACLMFALQARGKAIRTVEGLAQAGQEGETLHPLQQGFLEHAALQCGICTPGFLVASKALLERTPDPTETEIRYWLAGNLCRCTGYDKIVTAVMDTAAAMRKA